MPLKHYRELIAWQLAMDVVVSTYHATEAVPDTERYGSSPRCGGRQFRCRPILLKDRRGGRPPTSSDTYLWRMVHWPSWKRRCCSVSACTLFRGTRHIHCGC